MRLGAVLAVVALAGGLVACGDSDDDGAQGNGASASTQAGETTGGGDGSGTGGGGDATSPDGTVPATGTDEEQIRAVFDQMARAIETGDGATACEFLARSVVSRFKTTSREGTCADGFSNQVASMNLEGTPLPKFESVEIKGNRATLFATPKGADSPGEALLVKQNGQWKISSWLANT